jgi:hypothetical protein
MRWNGFMFCGDGREVGVEVLDVATLLSRRLVILCPVHARDLSSFFILCIREQHSCTCDAADACMCDPREVLQHQLINVSGRELGSHRPQRASARIQKPRPVSSTPHASRFLNITYLTHQTHPFFKPMQQSHNNGLHNPTKTSLCHSSRNHPPPVPQILPRQPSLLARHCSTKLQFRRRTECCCRAEL